jgi:hypothetical protein
MTPSQIQTHARALVARMYPSATDAVVVAVESYGQRRLYPITAAADAVAALVGARTIDERHLDTARALGVTPRITTMGALASPMIDDAARAIWWRETIMPSASVRVSTAAAIRAATWNEQATAAEILNKPNA